MIEGEIVSMKNRRRREVKSRVRMGWPPLDVARHFLERLSNGDSFGSEVIGVSAQGVLHKGTGAECTPDAESCEEHGTSFFFSKIGETILTHS